MKSEKPAAAASSSEMACGGEKALVIEAMAAALIENQAKAISETQAAKKIMKA